MRRLFLLLSVGWFGSAMWLMWTVPDYLPVLYELDGGGNRVPSDVGWLFQFWFACIIALVLGIVAAIIAVLVDAHLARRRRAEQP